MELFKKNLRLLRKHDPALATRVERTPLTENITVTTAKNGKPVPQVQTIFLHSCYQPELEARKNVALFSPQEESITVAYGLGFGYHVLELLQKTQGEIIVIEPLMGLFRAFMETMDLEPYLPRTRFLISEPCAKILARYQPEKWNIFVHKPSMRISRPYFLQLKLGIEANEYLGKNCLKILVVNPIYGGSLPTAHFSARGLEQLGHQVEVVECEQFSDSFHSLKNISKNKKNSAVLSHQFMLLMQEIILAKAVEFNPDLILALAQAPMGKDVIERLRPLGVPIVFWFVEDFRTLKYWQEIAPLYDHFFTIQQNEFFDELAQKGVKNYYYLPQAACPGVHKPLRLENEEKENYSADLSFMGAAYYNRRQSFPRLLDFDFKIWGTGWDLNTGAGKCVQNLNLRVSEEECVKIYNGGKVNLNLHSSTFHEGVNPNGDCLNPRLFEIASCGAFQLADKRSLLDELFVKGEEIVTFSDIDELREQIRYYLDHEEERKAIAQKARERILKDHTFEKRMTEMLICIYQDRLEELKARLEQRFNPLEFLIEKAGKETALGQYLGQFKESRDFSLETVVDQIEKGEGNLSREEMLMLMLDQVMKKEKAKS